MKKEGEFISKYSKYHPSYQEDDLILEIVGAAEGFDGLSDANLYFMSLCARQLEFVQLSKNVYRCKDYYMAKQNDTGVYQKSNGYWEYRFRQKVKGRRPLSEASL